MDACGGSNTAASNTLDDLITGHQSAGFTQFSKNDLSTSFKGIAQATKLPIKAKHLDTSKHTILIPVVIPVPQWVG